MTVAEENRALLEECLGETREYFARDDFFATPLGRWFAMEDMPLPFSFTMPSGAEWEIERLDDGTYRVWCGRDGQWFSCNSANMKGTECLQITKRDSAEPKRVARRLRGEL